ncbi:MAG: S41 family peptidase [Planctomycetota bacterium]
MSQALCRRPALRAVSVLAVLLAVVAVSAPRLTAEDHGAAVQTELDGLAKASAAQRWVHYLPLLDALQNFPGDALPVIQKALPKADAGTKLVASAALILAQAPDPGKYTPLAKIGADTLVDLLENPPADLSEEDRMELSGVLMRSRLQLASYPDCTTRLLKLVKGDDKLSALTAARVLGSWRVDFDQSAAVVPLLSSKQADIRDSATIVACELALYEDEAPRVAIVQNLAEMAAYPNTLGDYASTLQRNISLEFRLRGVVEPRREPGKNGFVRADGEQLLRDIVDKITVCYVDEDKVDLQKLYEAAAIGMVDALDPFSAYLTQQDVEDTEEKLGGKYYGIGAYVGMRDGLFTIISPIYGSPADKAGLKSMDRIIKVDDVDIRNMSIEAIIKRLKGPAGTKVKLEFWRAGLTKPRALTVPRAEITVPSVIYGVLPGDIAYMRLTTFGEDTAADCRKALAAMNKDHDIRAVVVDLRNNPGGLLNTAVDVASLFLPKGDLVVYSQGRPLVFPKQEYFVKTDPIVSEPVGVLVNSGSASASEIVSGALHDHKRAFLVGEKTFGKGSVQQPFPMAATGDKTELKLTIAKYYLPNGECIHQKGIEPDIPIETPIIPGWKYDDFDKIAADKSVEKYFTQYYAANTALFDKLAFYDGGDVSQYPGFKDFYTALKTHLSQDDVRLLLRAEARNRYEANHHEELAFDIQEDTQLRRCLLELDRRHPELGLRKIEVYKNLDQEFKEKPQDKELEALLKEKDTGSATAPAPSPTPAPETAPEKASPFPQAPTVPAPPAPAPAPAPAH